jgi:hypothetical protein
VFYSDDNVRNNRQGGDWKVICGTDVRGRRGDLNISRPEVALLTPGKDSEFKGLRCLQ